MLCKVITFVKSPVGDGFPFQTLYCHSSYLLLELCISGDLVRVVCYDSTAIV